ARPRARRDRARHGKRKSPVLRSLCATIRYRRRSRRMAIHCAGPHAAGAGRRAGDLGYRGPARWIVYPRTCSGKQPGATVLHATAHHDSAFAWPLELPKKVGVSLWLAPRRWVSRRAHRLHGRRHRMAKTLDKASDSADSPAPKRILIADDDGAIRGLLCD